MEDHIHTHALAEVAFALAMAFFSVMVLAMVSMGIPVSDQETTNGNAEDAGRSPELARFEAAKTPREAEPDPRHTRLLIYSKGHIYDKNLHEVDIAALLQDGNYLLALSPELSVDEAMSVKARILSPNVSITLLNEHWLNRLEAGP